MRTKKDDDIAKKSADGEPLTASEIVHRGQATADQRPKSRLSKLQMAQSIHEVARHHVERVENGWAGGQAVVDAAATVNSALDQLNAIDPRALRLALTAIEHIWQFDDCEPVRSLRADSQQRIRNRSAELTKRALRAKNVHDTEGLETIAHYFSTAEDFNE